jgi:Domain of unknown function (DUF4349)
MSRPARPYHPPATVAATVLAAVLGLASCAGAAPSSDQAGGGAGADSAGNSAAMPEEAARKAPGAPEIDQSTGRNAASIEITTRAIIRTAEIAVRTEDVQAAADRATALAQAGDGYVASQQATTDPDPGGTGETGRPGGPVEPSSVTLVLRVPVDDFDRVVRELGRLGTVLTDKRDTSDVTEQVVDVESRVANQKRSIQRLRTLLGQAKTVGEVVQVESELTNREAELESLQARYETLSSQAALSTIRVVFESPAVAPPDGDDSGFLAGLRAGWSAFVAVLQGLLTAIGAIVPFGLALALLVGVPAWFLIRARARRRSTPAQTPSAP